MLPWLHALSSCSPDVGTAADVERIGAAPRESLGTASEDLFDPERVHAIDLTLSQAAMDALDADRGELDYQEGVVRIDGRLFPEVGVRLKGSSSYASVYAKPSLKIDLDRYRTGQDVGGDSQFTLNSLVFDDTVMHESLGYAAFAALGLPSARVAYAWLRVNDADYGLYALVETQGSRDWLEHWTGSREGRVYEGGYPWRNRERAHADFRRGHALLFELEAGDDVDNADLVAAADVAEAEDAWFAGLDTAFDTSGLVAAMAAEIWISQWDGYYFSAHNFRVYVSGDDGRVRLVPAGLDLAFTEVLSFESPVSALGGRCWEDAACREALTAQVDVTCTALDELDLVEQLDTLRARTAPYVEADPRAMYSVDEIRAGQDALREWLGGRSARLREELGIR